MDYRGGLVVSARWGAATAISALAWEHLDKCFVSPYLIDNGHERHCGREEGHWHTNRAHTQSELELDTGHPEAARMARQYRQCSSCGRNSPQMTEPNMAEPRGALALTTIGAASFGMGPTAPTQAARPVAHDRTLGRNDLTKSTVSELTIRVGGRNHCPLRVVGSMD